MLSPSAKGGDDQTTTTVSVIAQANDARPMMITAAGISVTETLALLDKEFREFALAFAEDGYAVWLGAGISMGKLPGLEGVAESAIENLRGHIDPSNPACPFKASLDNILGLATLTKVEWEAVDYDAPVSTWAGIEAIRPRLVAQYANLLDQAPLGQDQDYLVWSAVDVVGTYANPAIDPGPEHLGLAALIFEGVASDSASANWDRLVEVAVDRVSGGDTSLLQVRVLPADVKNNTTRARLYKFHGCAWLAGQNAGDYRDRLVGRASQIHGWADQPENKVMAAKLQDLATSKSTLMLGLSMQDTNIQNLFVVAKSNLPSDFPTAPPAVILSEDKVGVNQRSFLKNFYKADYAKKASEIEASALLRAYAAALLPALWLHVLCTKVEAFIATLQPGFSPDEQVRLVEGLRRLRDDAAKTAVPEAHEAFMLGALPRFGRAMSLFRDGRALGAAEGYYRPLTTSPAAKVLADPGTPGSGLIEAALGLALVGRGCADGLWSCRVGDPADPKTGALTVIGAASGRTTPVFIVSNARAAAKLVTDGHVAENDDAVILHSHEVALKGSRTPTAAPGRTGLRTLREIALPTLATGTGNLDSAYQQFRSQVAP